MPHDVLQVLFVGFGIWGVGVAYKAWKALSKREPYTFSFWDGGIARAGHKLTRAGTKVKLGAGLLISAGCGILLAGIRIGEVTYFILVGLIVLSVISDFMNTES